MQVFTQKVPALLQHPSGWQTKSSIIKVGISKNAFKNEPPTTLPQCLHINLPNDVKVVVYPFQYQLTAFPETQKLTEIYLKNYMNLLKIEFPKQVK